MYKGGLHENLYSNSTIRRIVKNRDVPGQISADAGHNTLAARYPDQIDHEQEIPDKYAAQK